MTNPSGDGETFIYHPREWNSPYLSLRAIRSHSGVVKGFKSTSGKFFQLSEESGHLKLNGESITLISVSEYAEEPIIFEPEPIPGDDYY